jgi:hypothetical protein
MWATDICIRQLHDAVWGVPSIEKGTNALEKRVLHQRVALKGDFFQTSLSLRETCSADSLLFGRDRHP